MKCRSCGAPILWAETPKGKRIPIDPTPVPDGNIFLVTREGGRPPLAMPAITGNPDRWKSHFATCPNADKHRKRC